MSNVLKVCPYICLSFGINPIETIFIHKLIDQMWLDKYLNSLQDLFNSYILRLDFFSINIYGNQATINSKQDKSKYNF
jgi:hypothetical protein